MNTAQPLSETCLPAVLQLVATHGLGDTLLASLRQTWPGVHFTGCMDDDIPVNAKPVAGGDGFNIYLVNSSNHCSVLTNDFDVASGMVIAEVLPD